MDKAGKNMSRRELLAMLAALTAGNASAAPREADPVKLNPRAYKVLLENDKVRVLEYHSKPGLGVCGQGRHSHPEHLTIALTAGKAKIRTEDGKVILAPVQAGEVFWEPASVHEVENVSGRDMRAYMVEYKDRNWKPSTG